MIKLIYPATSEDLHLTWTRQTKLPDDYLELEKRVDALKQVHQKRIQVTYVYNNTSGVKSEHQLIRPFSSSQYTHEAYDYPTNIRESFNDLGRTVSEKVTLLSSASSASEAASAMTAPPSAKPQPKTFAHAMARASLASSQALKAVDATTTVTAGTKEEDALATGLEK